MPFLEDSANLTNAKLSRADIRQADLRNADASHASFRGANLSGGRLRGADPRRANFSEWSRYEESRWNVDIDDRRCSNLRGADFTEPNLSHADLSKGNFIDAHFWGAHLRQVKFDHATLTGAEFWKAQIADWSVRDIVYEYAFWDKFATTKSQYASSEF